VVEQELVGKVLQVVQELEMEQILVLEVEAVLVL
jgi:hypothetical protein